MKCRKSPFPFPVLVFGNVHCGFGPCAERGNDSALHSSSACAQISASPALIHAGKSVYTCLDYSLLLGNGEEVGEEWETERET